ncbi:MAG: 23S rRNA (pseudouridine(1915)-N(3))-methyltransferase RlmH [Polyangiaceae bacterium]
MRIFVVAVGKLKERALRTLADDYLERIRRYCRCDEIEVRESADLSRQLGRLSTTVALEVDGRSLSSSQLSRELERWGRRGKGDVGFVIGGADGLPQALSQAADERLSLSTLTLPHQLARVLLLEQLYRSHTLLRGEPYAREG